MEPIVKQLHRRLLQNKKTVAVAESCTGGLLSSLLTGSPGSSGFFLLGIVAYSNKAKEKLLRIPSRLIKAKGAVSPEVACAMAASVKKIAAADFGIGITGIAGPTGASRSKPVGTVFIATASHNRLACARMKFTGTRNAVRKKSALHALRLLKDLV
jgi:nicotinamide-nucleotide amidase